MTYRLLLRGFIAAFAAAAVATGALAEPGSPECLQLEGSLAALDRGANAAQVQKLQQALAKQRAELDKTTSYMKSIGCGRRFIFGPQPPAECTGLEGRVRQMQGNLDKLSQDLQAAQGSGPAVQAQRRTLLVALARNQCGPQYKVAETQPRSRSPAGGGIFGALFGAPRESEPDIDPVPMDVPKVSTYRTVCVRMCDGFFFPISFATVGSAFQRDEAICKMTCPGAEASLFAYPNPGGSIEQAFDPAGQPYSKIPNAFRYQKEYVKDCSCKPANMSWGEALAGVEDKTVRKGDVVIDEAAAARMSQPKAGDPVAATGKGAKGAAAAAPVEEPIVEDPGTTGPAGGSPAANPNDPNIFVPAQ